MAKFCILDDARQSDNCGECYICIYDKSKVCNNCEKCLWGKMEGKPDISSIKIDEIITINEEIDDDGTHIIDFNDTEINEDDLGETIEENFWEKEDRFWMGLERKYRVKPCPAFKNLKLKKLS
jgi:hypothetical protein